MMGHLGGWLLRELKSSRRCKIQHLEHGREEGTTRHRIKWLRVVARSEVSYCPFAMQEEIGGSIFEAFKANQRCKIEQLEQCVKEDNDSEDGRMPEADWLVLAAKLGQEKLGFAREELRHIIHQEAQMSSWKDPLYIMRYSYKVLILGLLTENDIRDIIMSRQDAVRCGDSWFAPSFLGCCMSISDKIARPSLDSGCTDEHEKGVHEIKGLGEEVPVPWRLVSKRVRLAEEERQAGAYLSGSYRGKGVKRTGGMDLVLDFVKRAKSLEDQAWKPAMSNA